MYLRVYNDLLKNKKNTSYVATDQGVLFIDCYFF